MSGDRVVCLFDLGHEIGAETLLPLVKTEIELVLLVQGEDIVKDSVKISKEDGLTFHDGKKAGGKLLVDLAHFVHGLPAFQRGKVATVLEPNHIAFKIVSCFLSFVEEPAAQFIRRDEARDYRYQDNGTQKSFYGSSPCQVGNFGMILDLRKHAGEDLETQVIFIA